MPVTIACPKCQTKYKLPDSSLGKAVKCKKCGTGFKTKAPGQQPAAAPAKRPTQKAAGQASPGQSDGSRQRAQEMEKLGIDGPLRRQGDIFGAGLPAGAGQLGNFAAEDPGFGEQTAGNADTEHEEEQQNDQAMASILGNPYVSPSAAGGVRGRVKRSGNAADGYRTAKIGMWMVHISAGVLVGVAAILGLFRLVGRVAPDQVIWLAETAGPTFVMLLGIFVLVLVGLFFLAGLAIFVGQICCIFSPNKDEKLFAGLAVGAIGLAFLTFLGIFLMGVVGGSVGPDADGARVVMGLFAMLGIFAVYGLVLANLFLFIGYFKRVGKNISSKKVVKASKTAMLTCIGAIVLGIITGIALGIIIPVMKDKPDFLLWATDISFSLNLFLWFSVTGTILAMVKTTLDVLKKKS